MSGRKKRNGVRIALVVGLAAVAVALVGCELFWLIAPGVPTAVEATDGGHVDRIVVAWQSVVRTIRYEIYRALSEDGTYAKVGENTTATYSDTEINVNTTYWYKVKACNRGGCSDLSSADSGYATGAGVPEVPTGIAATDGTYIDRVRVTWNAAPGATQYEVWREVTQGGPYTLRGTVSGTTYDDRDASPGRLYWYKLKACNASGCSAFSSSDSGFTFATAPDPATDVSASDGTYSDRVQVTWTAAAGAATYEVHRSDSEGGTYAKRGDSTGTSYNDTPVTVGTTYWYKVKACNSAGCSAFSVPDSGYAQTGGGGGGGGGGTPDLPGQPRNVIATDGAFPDKIRVTWSSVSGATRYEIWRSSTDTGGFAQVGETTGTTYDDTAPAMCEVRWYEVRACNASGCGPFSVANDGYRGATLDNVDGTKVKATVVFTGSTTAEVRLTWVDVKQTAEYQVKYEVWRRIPAGIPAKIATVSAPSHTDTDVALGTTYYYKIRACSDHTCFECSAFTGEVQAVVACNPAPPTSVTATLAAPNVNLAWPVVTGAAKYEVYRATTDGGAYTYVGWNATNAYTDTPGSGTFYYKVKTCVTCGCGGLSAASNAVTVP